VDGRIGGVISIININDSHPVDGVDRLHGGIHAGESLRHVGVSVVRLGNHLKVGLVLNAIHSIGILPILQALLHLLILLIVHLGWLSFIHLRLFNGFLIFLICI
jgi:hypothetical protein